MPYKFEKILAAIQDRIPTDGPKICDKVNAIFLFEVEEKKGGPSKKWTINLKDKPGKNQLMTQEISPREKLANLTVILSSLTMT